MLWQGEAEVTNHTLPNFIIAGINKAGTTSVYTYLNSHPQVCGSSIKEVLFFNKEYMGDKQTDAERYSTYFDKCNSGNPKIVFEASPNYIYGGRKTALRMRELIPDVKLLFILREPVSYLYSRYNFSVNNKQDIDGRKVSFEEYVRRNVAYCDSNENPSLDGISKPWLLGCIENGKYAHYLSEYFEVLPRKNIKIMFFDALKADVLSFMSEVCEFLEIDPEFYNSYDFYQVNKTYVPKNRLFHKLCSKINMATEPYFRRHPGQKRILTGWYKSINQGTPGYVPMPAATRQFLLEYYRESNLELARLLQGQEMPEWVTREFVQQT